MKDGTEISRVCLSLPCSSRSVLNFRLSSTRFLIKRFLIKKRTFDCFSIDTVRVVLVLLAPGFIGPIIYALLRHDDRILQVANARLAKEK